MIQDKYEDIVNEVLMDGYILLKIFGLVVFLHIYQIYYKINFYSNYFWNEIFLKSLILITDI